MSFNWAQTFNLDPTAVNNATEVGITRVDLYFRAKPPATNNKSGIVNPGVEVKVVPCVNGIPMIDEIGAVRPTEPTEHGAKFAFYSSGRSARKEWGEIQASTDGNVATRFLFENPYFVKTNSEYAILIKYDGNEDFILWTAKSGNPLVGSSTTYSAPTNNGVGRLYQYISNVPPSVGAIPGSNNVTSDSRYISSNWTPLTDTDLKFKVYVSRYFSNGVPVTSNNTLFSITNTKSTDRLITTVRAVFDAGTNKYTLTSQSEKLEYIKYDLKNNAFANINYGESVYQVQPYYPGAGSANNTGGANAVCTVSVISNTRSSDIITANANYIHSNGVSFNGAGGFNNIFNLAAGTEYIIIDNGNSVNVRRISQIISNTQIRVDSPVTFTNNAAKFFKSPVGQIHALGSSYFQGKNVSLLTLYNSNATRDNRFVNNAVSTISINNGGTGYSNSDYIVISGFENVANKVVGGYNATANIITNVTGTITQVLVTNAGCGFVNTAWLTGSNVIIANSSGANSTGTNANLNISIGSTVKTEFNSNNFFGNCEIINFETNRIKPEITVNNPLGTSFNIRLRTLFHKINDNTVSSGIVYRINQDPSLTDSQVKIFKNHDVLNVNTTVIPSRSNEFIIPYANGALGNSSILGTGYSNAATLLFDISSNNDFSAPFIDPEIIRTHFAKYVINNDYTNEHTNYGNAYSKHITSKVNFATDRFAEDLLVYLTAYRPSNTDIKVYARIHNSKDPEAFDDKDWTLLELIDGVGVFSSQDNSADYREYTYNFTQYPNTDVTLVGTANVQQGQAFITGSGTLFSNSSVFSTFNSNTSVANTTDFISLSPQPFANNDTVTYYVAAGNTAVSGLTNNTIYYVVQANTSGIKLSSTKNGANINITAGVSESGHSLYRTAVVPDDLIKIYSPIFPNNYVIHVVNNVVNATYLTIKRSFGDLSANLSGTVSVNTTSTTVDGTSTTFTADFTNGDFIAVWSNSSVYEVRGITSITDANTLVVDSAFTFANGTSNYAILTASDFLGTDRTVGGLKIDRLAFKNQAFNNKPNDNVVRYYNSSMVEFDTFDTYQLKIVFLSDNDQIVPKVDDIRSIGVSA